MRLLLDEMYPSVVAERLRARGHDVVAVTERPELRSLADAEVFTVSQRERRTVVTENVADFASIADSLDERGQAHFGLVLIDPVKYRRGHSRTIGRMVTGLDRLLRDHPSESGYGLAPLAVTRRERLAIRQGANGTGRHYHQDDLRTARHSAGTT